MTLEEKQIELDVAKWNKSQSLKLDACGTFNYCASCDKGLNNPCAHAYSKFFNEELESAEVTPEKKKATKKTTSEKKTATKKCAKKESTKKETKKTTKKTTKEL